MALDNHTLRQVDGWLAELAAEAERLPAREWTVASLPTDTATLVGQWQGVENARAYIAMRVEEERAKQGVAE